MKSLKIKVIVANRTYPLTIKREDEEQVRKAVKVIEGAIKGLQKQFCNKRYTRLIKYVFTRNVC